jgi:hypothetical protein
VNEHDPAARPGQVARGWPFINAAVLTATPPGTVRRLVVLPSLWPPVHHRLAVAALGVFVEAVVPDGIVFMNAPGEAPAPTREAFVAVLAALRAVYRGPVAVHGPTMRHTAVFAGLDVATLPESAVVPGWRAASLDPHARPDRAAHTATAGANVVCGATGRLRLTGHAVPAEHGTMRAWLVFECGTLAADPSAGTLGFGVLEINGATVTARPVRVGTEGSFTYRGTPFQPP